MTASTRPSLLFFLRLSKSAMPSSPDRKPPSPSSASAPPLMEHHASASNFCTQRRLTRSRKLRHVSDDELGFHPSETERSLSSPLSPNSPLKSRSDHCSSSAVPHPLPLPELWLRRNTANSGSPVAAGMSCSAIAGKDSDHGVPSSPKSPRKCYRRVFQNSNSEAASYNLRLKVPVRSAPSSPSVSPPRASETIDLFPSQPHPVKRAYSHHVDAKGIHYNCGLNASTSSDLKHGFSTPVSPQRTDAGDLFVPTFTGFPVWNTRNRIPPRNSKSLNSSPLHHSLLRKRNMEWLHAQPLPLPPGALVPPPSPASPLSTIGHHSMERTEASSPMKNQWKKGKLIGRGTFGSVYVGSNRETGALCAMKEVDLAPDEPKAAECIRQLEQEIKVLGQLKHPNIVQYYGSEIVDDHFYIYLEYVHPGSINKYVQEHVGDMTESVVRNFTRHILSGLAYLHSTKTVHRDIKGANLLVDATGVVKLADFGMAKLLTGQASLLSLKGSPHWMAPEGTVPKDANPDIAFAVDIWSLGCTIIEMVTGKPPWSEFEGPAAMFKVLHRSPPIPETLSSEGKNFLQLCFRRNPAERPSASKLLEHPFIHSLHDQSTSASMHTFYGLNLMDRPLSPRGTWMMNGSPQREGRTYHSPEWYAETFGHMTATRQAPSMVETRLPCPAQLNRLLLNLSPSHMHFGAVNNHPCAPSRTRGREVSHL